MLFVKVDHPSRELVCCMASSYVSDDSESDFTVVIEKVGWLNRTWSNGDNESQFMSDPVLSESDFPDYCDDQDFLLAAGRDRDLAAGQGPLLADIIECCRSKDEISFVQVAALPPLG